MKRRDVIQRLVIVAGGFVLVPSCLQQPGKASIALKLVEVTDIQEHLLAAVASAIIPATDTPGAGDLGCHLFVLKMLDDCYEKEAQQKFMRGLNDLESYAKQKFSYSFAKCTGQQQQDILKDIEEKKINNADITGFFDIMKEKTLEGYLTSKYVLTNINKYEFIPSEKYNGYAPVKQ
ncbi:MAG: gluconate 2-dehydrogenase subunit 3 family protein [Chitinophagaceae bacterium]|nr:gluconate 2-dehydrogenase subunit 3 family protein [Chitinophagaceae bacterium]